MKGFKQQAGVSWLDVELAISEFEAEHDCRLECTLSRVRPTAYTKAHLRLKGCASGGLLSAGLSWRREYSIDWPTYGVRTMTGLYLRLIHEMSESLAERPPKPGKAWKTITPPIG